MASITPTDILTKPLFNWSDVADMRQPAVKAEKDKKQATLQNEYCDVLFKEILQTMSSAEAVKTQLIEKSTVPVLIWTANEVFFQPHSSIPRRDCRSERFGNIDHSVEEIAIYRGYHQTVNSPIAFHENQSIYAVLKYTDILHLLAARWDSSVTPHFTCERYTSQCGESNRYWRPQEHTIYLRFWPDGVPAHHAECQKAALDGYETRYRSRHPRVVYNPEDE